MDHTRGAGLLLVLIAAVTLAACTSPAAVGRHPGDPVVAAAGDIACDPMSSGFHGGVGGKAVCHERAISDLLLNGHFDAVLPLGDEQYECGVASGFRASYDPTWGRLRAITHPVIGNHEYGKACHRNDPSGYFGYFGATAGPATGYYSFDVGTWHVVVLNSECSSGRLQYKVGGCSTGSPQDIWLRSDLARHRNACTLAAWHEPRFSSGEHGDAQQMADLWNDLVVAHADVVLSGHNHDFERFDPIGATPGLPVAANSTTAKSAANFQQPRLDPNGIREFVVGTGGKNHYQFRTPPLHGEKVRNSDTYGVLTLALHPHGYEWHFVPEPGYSFSDSGSAVCH